MVVTGRGGEDAELSSCNAANIDNAACGLPIYPGDMKVYAEMDKLGLPKKRRISPRTTTNCMDRQ